MVPLYDVSALPNYAKAWRKGSALCVSVEEFIFAAAGGESHGCNNHQKESFHIPKCLLMRNSTPQKYVFLRLMTNFAF